MTYQYQCKSKKEQEQACKLLVALGCKFADGLSESDKNPKGFIREFNLYTVINYSVTEGISGSKHLLGYPKTASTLGEFIDMCNTVPIMVGQYEVAKIDGGVRINGQEITIEELEEILALAKS